ncbi:stage II sporulation protein M [Halovivax gelatinilyticus]|uniref:stage II sporulation protein M n=1 Tax=Halovivax gelatinilyticus TaxID=2961597 RepID=UPI0020CA7A13|nr:stage II sporulation protein M [Halovivax gelatinilyticus]
MDERSGDERVADDDRSGETNPSRESPERGHVPRVPDSDGDGETATERFPGLADDRPTGGDRSNAAESGAADAQADRIPIDPSLDLDGDTLRANGSDRSGVPTADAVGSEFADGQPGIDLDESGSGWWGGVGCDPDPDTVRFWAGLLSALGLVSFLVAGAIYWQGPVDAAVGAALLGTALLAAGVYGLRSAPHVFGYLSASWREHRRYVHLTVGLFALGIVVGAIVASADVNVLDALEELTGEDPFADLDHEDLTATWFIENNTQPFLLAIAGAATLGLLTLFLLVFNGIVVGNVAWFATQSEGIGFTFVALAPHAIFELTAIFVAAAVGFRLLHRFAQRISGSRESFVTKPYLLRTTLLVAFAWSLLVLAAFVEAHVTVLALEGFFAE